MRMTIKAKLAAAFGIVLVLLAGLVYVSVTSLGATNAQITELVEVAAERIRIAGAMREQQYKLDALANRLVLEEDVAQKVVLQGEIAEARSANGKLAAALEALSDERGRGLLAEFRTAAGAYDGAIDAVVAKSLENTNIESADLSLSLTRPQTQAIMDGLQEVRAAAAQNPTLDQTQIAAATYRVEIALLQAVRFEKNAILSSDDASSEAAAASAEAARAELAVTLDALGPMLGVTARPERERLSASFERFVAATTQVIGLAVQNSNAEALVLLEGDGASTGLQILGVLDQIVELNSTKLAEAKAEADAAYGNNRTLLLSIAGVALTIGFVAAVWISLSISRGLTRAVNVAQSIAIGDLDVDANPTTRDEIGDLLGAMDRMSGALREITHVAEKISQGDLTVHSKRRSDVDTLGIALEEMLTKLRDVVSNANASANGVAEGAQAMSATAEQLSQGSTEQAAAAQEASAAMEQMNANIRQSADNAAQTEKIATQSAKEAADSGQAVDEAVRAMKTIAAKINIIQEIARQTDLLALNAAVEAARAGQHGKGFAVVASEVRKLAERSQQAAQEIGELSGKTVEVSQRAGEMLSALVPSIRRTADLVQEISAATREQNAGAEQINDAIRELDTVIQQNASAATEASSTSQELASQSEALRSVISFFRLGEETHRPAAQTRRPVVKALPAPRHKATHKGSLPRPLSTGPAPKAGANGAKGGIDLDLGTGPVSDADFERY